ncbi:dihydrolipoamide acetyltransferase family protein [Terribacillus saccharophilus]|uniref:Dihydrolipoamide acetyltransferase component of pyruvate dehydrogenase complex n=1 Tax=Terribacillus saccharophilus TaxID=361277 RepID=A0ABX4H2E0_9BACI|nr:dihydrolipoamide acetyltransferase family protein [Terribacillus saccharophilus]PAD36844.1 branched-chain alpha-keto acid dehydrogenase subunit E2 [Terribacillus saccharophilus]PAD97827.1 branched-chain alpha-keto acid dehydrogenase subunit E2 [Terribacillus saccharophilus]PAE01209.1 branched-chain alpha-keto acid dehydrogenase subunit E2 [Terribacillus saccharophilus]
MTIEKITMPKLGESVTEGTISTWLVKPGDQVSKYDAIAEVMTDKVNAEIPSSFTGVIKELVVSEGDTVEVGTLICTIETEEAGEKKQTDTPSSAAAETESISTASPDTAMKSRYSPAVMRLAQENDLDLTAITGTGKGGRITRKDVEAIIASGEKPQKQEQKQTATAEAPSPVRDEQTTEPAKVTQSDAAGKAIPVTGVRKAIANNMVKAATEIPHAWMMVEVDVTDLVAYRNKVKDTFKEKEGYSLTFFSFFVKAIAQALKEFPQLNSSWAGDKIIQHDDVNISIAVAKDQELFVPVIQSADDLSVKGVAKQITNLAKKARTGKLTAADMQGGTFTVNNTGSFGSVQSMGIINYPQAAILQVESIVKRPVIINDMFAARDMVNLCLSLDHRVLDGLICGQFMARVKEILENVSESTMPVY